MSGLLYLEMGVKHRLIKKVQSRGIADKFIWNEFEQQSVTKLPRSGEVHGRTS